MRSVPIRWVASYSNRFKASRTARTLNFSQDKSPCIRFSQQRCLSVNTPSNNDENNSHHANTPLTTASNSERHVRLIHDQSEANGAIVTTLVMDRPKANAWNKAMLAQLNDALDEMELSDSRCLLLTSALPKVFSAGADLKERATMTIDEAELFVAELRNTFQRVAELPCPVVACLQGAALGGGLELALAADVRMAAADCKLGLVETSLAIVPGAGGTQRLARLVGPGRAMDWIASARTFTGAEAYECGLVEHLVEENDSVAEKGLALARQIAANGPVAVRAAKRAIHEGLEQASLREALAVERAHYAKCLPTSDRLEGLAAFRDGRTPQYRGE